jgi:hypothetical protein
MRLNSTKKLEIAKFGRQAITSPFNNHQINEAKMNIKANQLNCNQKTQIQVADFKLIKNNQEIVFRLKGQKVKTLKCLIEHKENGCNALEIAKTFALRLSEYIRALRRDGLAGGYNLNIVTNREKHIGGWHGKYVLHDQVELLKDYSGVGGIHD